MVINKVNVTIFILMFLAFTSMGYIAYDVIHSEPEKPVVYERESEEFTIPMNPNFRIMYDGLSLKEQENVGDVLGEFDPKYFALHENITFTKNISQYCDDCIGLNRNNGENIYIQYYNDKEFLFKLVCHELLHTFFRIPLELEEELVEDAELKKICYGRIREVTND